MTKPLPPSIWFMAAAAGLAAANLHYSQPLLPSIAEGIGAPIAKIGLLPAVTQCGFALGIITILPASDILERKRVVLTCLMIVGVALMWHATAGSVASLYAAGFLVGIAGVVPQLMTPFASVLAPEGRAGAAVGFVLSGILTGVLISKVLAGLTAETLGWRWQFAFASIAMFILAALAARILPRNQPDVRLTYGGILKSTIDLVKAEPRLRLHAANGALTFAAFMSFWASYAVYLDQTHGYGPGIAGLFGIVGLAGALAASFAGKSIDAGHFSRVQLVGGLAMGGGFLLIYGGNISIALMIIGLLALDFGAGLTHAGNQTEAFKLRPDARGRINSVYMASYFVGGAIGTAVSVKLFLAYGWGATCLAGGLFGIGPLLLSALATPRARVRSTPPAE